MLRLRTFYQKAQPQSILEELISFFNQGNVFFDEKIECKRFAALPFGNRLYTGPIQALGYSYLNKAIGLKTIILITSSTQTDRAIMSTESFTEPILGKKIRINQKLAIYFPHMKKNNSIISQNGAITNQLPFIRVFTKYTIFPIIIPEHRDHETQNSISKVITQDKSVGIVCLSNHESTVSLGRETNDQKKIDSKLTKTHPTMQLLHNIAKANNCDLQLVLYNSTEPNKKNIIKNHYCLVG